MVLTENMVVADRFRLVRMIGRGGMGSVWQAVHLGLDIPCAVKFIEGELANVAEAHARFEREAKAAAQLRSPNVVQIFDHGVWQGRPFIAMELLEGEDLGKRLAKSGGRLPPPDVNFVVQQVCRALSRAHQSGVVHRDMKPDNIFVVKDDDRDIVKILDFGVAKSAAAALDGSNTKTGAMLGTPYYMSPEQAQGIKTVDSRSDLWSLAVIVFQCLTGRLPFESEALGDLLVKIIVSPVPTPSHYFPMVPVGFDAWWTRAADRNPDNRFQTAKAFAESLSLALGQSSITDTTERARLHRTSERPGGATAMMVNAPATEVNSNVPNTPQPGAPHPGTPQPGAHTAAMSATPNPHNTPQGLNAQQAGGQHQQHPQQQHPGGYMQAPPQATTGNPVAQTFPGLEPSGVPKKGAPVAVFVAIGALALVGLGLGGVAFLKGKSAQGGGDTSASAGTATPSADPSAAVASATPSAEPPASTAAKDPTPGEADAGAAVAAVTPAPVAPIAAGVGNTHRPQQPVRPTAPIAVAPMKPAVVAAPTPPVTPVAAPATGAAGKPQPKKPADLGF